MPLREGDLFILAVCLAGLALIIGGLLVWLGPGEAITEEEEEEEEEEGQQQLQVRGGLRRRRGGGGGGAAAGAARGGGARAQQLRRALREEGEDENENEEEEQEGEEEGYVGEGADERRQRKKDKIKAEKKALKEEVRRVREERERRVLLGLPPLQTRRREEDEEGREEGDEDEDEDEDEEAKAERLKKEEEEAEFQRWKAMMQVDGEGNTAEEEMEEEGLLALFIAYVKERKMMGLDELSARFKLPVKVILERLELLEGMGRLRGVVDDRGKYIEIEEEEMESVRKWVVRKGRVGVAELAMESNRLIKLKKKADEETKEMCG